MKFLKHEQRIRMQQSFDKDKIMLTKAGKTFNVYQKIQEAREDTEIYPTLEKYGSIDRMVLNEQEVYGEFQNFKNLRDLKDQQIQATNMFYNLPIETRQKFNNDMNLFMKNGEKYLKKIIDENKAKIEAGKANSTPATTSVENKQEMENK